MTKQLIVRGAPQEYELKAHAWDSLESHLNRRNIKNVLILHGEKSWEAVKPYFPELSITAAYHYYGGQCTDAAAESFASLCNQKKFDGIIAVGGGKVADLGKFAAYKAHLPIIILPTLAATCAAYTPLSVVYDEAGIMLRYDIFPKASDLVLIDPAVILASPRELMIAGIGDTLAKWYESHAIISQLAVKPIEVQVAEFAAQKCREILIAESTAALEAMAQNQLNQAFIDVVEANILLAGMVGGFGDEYGRTAGAHSLHDAMTVLPGSHQQLHGNKVAYGILVQLMIEENLTEIEQLLPFYHQLNLPTSLAEMNLHLTEEEYQSVAERACAPGEMIHLMKQTITPDLVIQKMKALEAFTQE
ncbi:iron-containing alcohol dehydrogenase family protein [Candidatus Enterococcus murrayae]|uniref:Iron-containing alcohol dehydrogenase family protein n=1 Tax=Candidatus Enterococcus murrayae TaxID=2815321 RepID=A0ABS3HN19_9ENTE|nr:iron-containing alcohol dehydrogenase family protein [Enterococcus sp. MJM16]MBO0454840.1 iron-containing alcohol dehydrogenase family protein [Enterococcus sp. MJM16]